VAPLPLAALAAALLAAAPAAGPESELLAADVAFDAAVAAKDRPAFLALVAEDAVFSGATLAVGRNAVRERWARFFEPDGPTLRWNPTDAGVAASGDLGWTVGDAQYEWKQKGASAPGLRYLTVWRRGPDGRWQAVLDGSLEPAAPGPSTRRPVRTFTSGDGSLEASIGTYERGDGADRKAGNYLTVRVRRDGAWRTILDSEMPSG
jgi:ketosteroid isomerase-like protein